MPASKRMGGYAALCLMLSSATITTVGVATTTPAEATPASAAAPYRMAAVQATAASRRMSRAEQILYAQRVATNQIGDWYRYGTAGPNTFDCSGLTYYSYAKAGVRLPRTSDGQARAARRVSRHWMRRGDLMFFHSGGNVYHVAMFLKWRSGKAVMVHAGRTGEKIRYDVPWTNSWYGGTMRLRRR